MTQTVRTCPDCGELFCLECDRGGPCKECGQVLCLVCFTMSHHGEAQGLCSECFQPSGAGDGNRDARARKN